MEETYQYLRRQISKTSDEAEQQVKARNSSEALKAKGKWITFDWMHELHMVVDKEGWARLQRLQFLLKFTSLQVLLEVT